MPKVFHNGINKQGLLIYGGESSEDYGMVVSEAPAFDRPVRKFESVSVPGRNGAILFQQDAYEDTVRTYRVWLTPNIKDLYETVNWLMSWLNSKTGYQRLEDSFEPEIFRLAYFSGGTEFSNKMIQCGEADLKFTCRPERFFKTGEIENTISNGTKMWNPTRFSSKPLIHIEGSGAISVSIGGKTITATVTDYVNIDCETMNAYRLATENKNSDISGDFPHILPGENTIGITGAPTKVTVVPRYYTI